MSIVRVVKSITLTVTANDKQSAPSKVSRTSQSNVVLVVYGWELVNTSVVFAFFGGATTRGAGFIGI